MTPYLSGAGERVFLIEALIGEPRAFRYDDRRRTVRSTA